MKHVYLLLAVLICMSSLKSQIYNNAFKIQSSGSDGGKAICTDGNANVVTAGFFSGSADFDPSTTASSSLTPNGSFSDIYIAKYDAALNYLWAIKLGGSSNDYPYALTTDASDNIIVGGDFQGTMHLNSTFSPSATLNSGGSSDRNGFVAKYDPAGVLLWGISIGSVNKDVVYGVKTDASSNIYVTGYFSSTVDFDPTAGTYTLSSNGGRDIFLAKYTPAGNLVWAFNVGGTISTAYEEGGQDLAIQGANIYLTGNFEGTADFNPDAATNNLISNGSLDIFVAKYDTAGNYVWAFGAGSNNKHDYSYGLDIDASENVYITGGFEETVDFDPSASTSTLVSASVSAQDIFVAKYNSSGTFQWAFQAGGNSLVDDHAFDIDVTPQGDFYITGEFWGPCDFDPSSGIANISTSNDQIFIARYSSSGNYMWAFEIGSTSGNGPADNGYGVHLANNGKLYVTGDFTGTADFDPGITTNTLSVNNQGHAFVASYHPDVVVGLSAKSFKGVDLQVYPNPSSGPMNLSIVRYSGESWNVTITDISGKNILMINNVLSSTVAIDPEILSKGVYFCTVVMDGKIFHQKLLFQ